MNYKDVARKIFSGSKYKATEEDVDRLANNMALLEKRGLGKLNKRLVDARKHTKIFETIAEHNFAGMLVAKHEISVPITYEPEIAGLKRPPDFKIEKESVTYWIQMKDLSKMERENRQDKIIQKIKIAAKEVKIAKFFSCMLSSDFKENCLPDLNEFIKEKASAAAKEESFLFSSGDNHRAKITFWPAESQDSLTLGYAGDLDVLDLTGLAESQIKQSLINASGAITWNSDEKNVNLIVIEVDNEEDIDICNALYGTEYEIFNSDAGHLGWSRKGDGLFSEVDFSKKIAGVVAIKRKQERDNDVSVLSAEDIVSSLSPEEKEISQNMSPREIKEALQWKKPGPIADYQVVLYMNENFKHLLEKIKTLLGFEKVIYYNMRPPMGQGDFNI